MLDWLFRRSGPNVKEPSTITAAELMELLPQGAVTLLDVRELHEYRSGHIKGSTLIPLMELSKRIHEVPGDRLVVTICHSGRRAEQARRILHSKGFDRVRTLKGGITQWTGKLVK